ncbi:MAG: hypothetical protein IPK67_18975 [Planctomycetes bacterium]|nr:hypothetical protein [Planctomycetota bacterium]
MKIPALLLLLLPLLLAPACHGPEARPARPPERTAQLQVIPLRFAEAGPTAASLKSLLRDVRIVADVRTNSLIVSYEDAEALRQVEQAVAKLDIEVR